MSSGEMMIGLSVEQALAVAPLLKELCTDDVAVVISDTECFIYYSRPRTFDLGIQVGQKLTENGGMTRAIRKGSALSTKSARRSSTSPIFRWLCR